MMDYEIKIIKKEKFDPFSNGLIVERDREKREIEWQLIEELVESARKRYLDGESSLENVMAETIEVLNNERNKRIEFLSDYDPSEELIRKDLKERHDEEIMKAQKQNNLTI